jgi:hypothetical protein
MADAIYEARVHSARPSVTVSTRAGSPAEARKIIKAMFPYTTRVTNLVIKQTLAGE